MKLITGACVLVLLAGACSSTTGPGTSNEAPEASTAADAVGPGSSADAAREARNSAAGRTSTAARRTGRTGDASSVPGKRGTSGAAVGGTIKIGIQVEGEGDTTSAAVGVEGREPAADPSTVYKVIVDWMNKHGGIAGRKIKLSMLETSVFTGSWDSHAQAACSKFAEDDKVFAAFAGPATRSAELFVSCLAKHGVVAFLEGSADFFRPSFAARYMEYFYLPTMARYDRLGLYADALVAQKYFSKTGKNGIITVDYPTAHEYVDDFLKPRFKRHGITITDTKYLYVPKDLAGLGPFASEASSTVLQFRSQGIDHVIFANTGGVGPFFFGPAAESQGYRPRYGFATFDFPNLMAENLSANQLNGATGMGWLPDMDVIRSVMPRPNRSRLLCRQIVTKAGLPAEVDNSCNGLFLLKAGLEKSRIFTPAGLRKGIEALRSDWESSVLLDSSFGPKRHDGAAAYRYMQYDSKLGRFKYVGPNRRIP